MKLPEELLTRGDESVAAFDPNGALLFYGDKNLAVRQKYDMPTDKKAFFYGGNLGKPQVFRLLLIVFKMKRIMLRITSSSWEAESNVGNWKHS